MGFAETQGANVCWGTSVTTPASKTLFSSHMFGLESKHKNRALRVIMGGYDNTV